VTTRGNDDELLAALRAVRHWRCLGARRQITPQSSFPVSTSNARNVESRAAPMKTSPPAVVNEPP